MLEFEKIKVVIWDLDETFWKGTLSEENVEIVKQNRELILMLTDAGIVNSICSKNDFQTVKLKLINEKLWDYFVFPSINWEAKGKRVKQLLKSMSLREQNALFLDDNPSNLEEVKFYCPQIMTAEPGALWQLYEEAAKCPKTDPLHKRLKQYQLLQKKAEEQEQYSNNEEFLLESNIRVSMDKDCGQYMERIQELILRSNQLNFTKWRSSQDELLHLLQEPDVEAAVIRVKDKFGDYGITGFYAMKKGELVHFLFSCRTLGMGIEQYVYNFLGRPRLQISGEVVSSLESEEIPFWINQAEKETTDADFFKVKGVHSGRASVILKGPCDLFQVFPYIKGHEFIDTEFTYVSPKGVAIETSGHTTHIVNSYLFTEQQKELLERELPFADAGMWSDRIFRHPYRIVIISILPDANLGVYRRKETGEEIAFVEAYHPLTDPKNWSGYVGGEFNTSGFSFTKTFLQGFAEKYEFVGRNTPERLVDNLSFIRKHLPEDTQLVVMLGSELRYEKNKIPAYEDRHIVHRQMNDAVRKLASEIEGISLLDVNKYLKGQSSYYDHFNHFTKPVYYHLAEEMVQIINQYTGDSDRIGKTSKGKMILVRIKEILAPYIGRFAIVQWLKNKLQV